MRKPEADSEFVACRVLLIKWITNYMHISKKSLEHSQLLGPPSHHEDEHHDSTHPSLESSKFKS